MKKSFTRLTSFGLLLLLIMFGLAHYRVIRDPLIKKKSVALTASREKVNTIFIGSSATYRSFDPVLFDELMARRNLQTTSFNYGIPGMNLLEIYYKLEYILNLDLPKLKYIFLEVNDFPLKLKQKDWRVWRLTHYHDFKRTFIAGKVIIQSSLPLSEKIPILKNRLKYFVKRTMLAGEISHLYKSFKQNRENRILAFKKEYPFYNGYTPLESELAVDSAVQRRRRDFLSPEGQQSYNERIDRIAPKDSLLHIYHNIQSATLEIIKDIRSLCDKKGLKLVVLGPPMYGKYSVSRHAIKTHLPELPLIEMNLRNKYPEFFYPKSRFDRAHLNRESAASATTLLVNLLVKGHWDYLNL